MNFRPEIFKEDPIVHRQICVHITRFTELIDEL